MSAPVDAVVQFYESLSLSSVGEARKLYARQAHFRDPFNDVIGSDQIERVLRHMFVQVSQPRFRITNQIVDANQAMLEWVFMFSLGRREIDVRGASMMCFDDEGRVIRHCDYWDTGEELYAKLPVLGWLVRRVRRRLSAK